MNFDELYEKYQNNTATEAERAYVEAEIAKARKLAALIDEQDSRRAVAPAEKEKVTRYVAAFLKKTRLRVAAIVLAAFLCLSLLLTAGFFTALSLIASGNSPYNKEEAVELVKKWMVDSYGITDTGELRVTEVDKDLAMHHGFGRAYYEYDVEIRYQGNEYEFWVDATDGEVRLVDRD